MNLLLKKIPIILILIIVLNNSAFSQKRHTKDANPLMPGSVYLEMDYGFFLGLQGNSQSGKYFTQCDCEFTNGYGSGFIAGALFERELFYGFKYGSALYISSKALKANFFEKEDVKVTSETSGKSEFIPINFENVSESFFLAFGVMPYLKFTPFRWMFARAGLSIDFPLSSKVTHTKELTQRTVLLGSGEIGIINLEDPRCESGKCKLEDRDFPDLVSPCLSITPAIGFNIPFSAEVNFSPLFQYFIPLSNISEHGEQFRISSWSIMLELRIALDDR